jgi:beta-mannanase
MRSRHLALLGKATGAGAALLLVAAALTLPAGGASAATSATKYFGVFREASPTAIASAETSQNGVKPASVMWFDNWATGNAFPVSEAKALWGQGIVPHYTWEPWNPSLGVSDGAQIHLQDILNGTWDGYIKARGAEFASVGSPIMVRWGHEFNGNWYPWGIANNSSDPSLYVRAYRHVHDLVRASGATNVQWIWAFNNGSTPDAGYNDPAASYPGDAYVDWVGIDGYNWGYGPSWDPTGNHWVSFASAFDSSYAKARSIAPHRPVTVSEYASSEDGGNKAQWINDMNTALQSGRYPDLKMLVYFDQNKEERWAAASSSAALSAFTSWLRSSTMNGTGAELAEVAGQYAGTTTTSPTSPSSSSPTSSSPTSSTPTTSTPTTSSPTTSTPASGPACTATYTVINHWNTGFQAQVSVRNSGTTALSGWTLRWTLPSGQGISQLWNGTLTQSGPSVTVTNAGWNGALAPNAGTDVGFLGSYTGSSVAAPAVTCTAT